MKRKTERVLWVAIVLSLFLLVGHTRLLTYIPLLRSWSPSELFKLYYLIEDSYVDELDERSLFEGALNGLFSGIDDRHSGYIPPEHAIEINDATRGEYGGIGLTIVPPSREDRENSLDYVKVYTLFEDGPAFQAGIRVEDRFYRIEGESVHGWSSEEIQQRIRGKSGEPIDITMLRGETETIEVTVIREIIETPVVKYGLVESRAGGVGLIQLAGFTPQATEKFKEAYLSLRESGARSLIIDLRGNPGGRLETVVEMVDLFLDDGVIVSVRPRDVSRETVYEADRERLVNPELDLYILIDGGSASASEILAGALRDHGRAALVGRKSYGKGSVQQIYDVGEGGKMRLTIARYYTPSGINLDQNGLLPDYPVESDLPQEGELEADAYALFRDSVFSYVKESGLRREERELSSQELATHTRNLVEILEERGVYLPERIVKRALFIEVSRFLLHPPFYHVETDRDLRKAIGLIEEARDGVPL